MAGRRLTRTSTIFSRSVEHNLVLCRDFGIATSAPVSLSNTQKIHVGYNAPVYATERFGYDGASMRASVST